jgi:hypothetical protein
MKISTSISLMAAAIMAATSAHAQIIPISVSGFNVDAIYGGNGDGVNGDVGGMGGGGYRYVSQTYASENPSIYGNDPGLPANGVVTSGLSTGTTFQFQPYTANNILVVRATDATLTLAPSAQGPYSNISFLLNNLTYNANTNASFVLNFSDGTSDTLTTSEVVPYWAGGVPASTSPTEIAGVAATFNPLEIGGGHDGTAINFDEYDFALSGSDATKTLQSVTIEASSNPLDVYAVSGTAVPEPGTWAMLLGGFGLLFFAGRLRAKLTV